MKPEQTTYGEVASTSAAAAAATNNDQTQYNEFITEQQDERFRQEENIFDQAVSQEEIPLELNAANEILPQAAFTTNEIQMVMQFNLINIYLLNLNTLRFAGYGTVVIYFRS
jgi:hemolysin activation/secretion protein